ncbi:MAG: OmpA family protein [Granulosicoccus sp.]|nr:OmpA family protein [Granulosicoccus sp.]
MITPHSSCRTDSAIWRRSIVAALVCSVLSGCSALKGYDRIEIPANTSDFRSRLYTGAAIGNSHLSPDTRGTVFNVDSSSDMGTQLRLGYDVHNMLAVELDTSVLGASKLREANTDVKYSSAAVSALVYGLSGVQMRSRREGLSAYGRLGYGTLKKSSAVLALEESGAVPIIGVGAEYGFSNGLGVRAELTRFDDDASYLGFGAIYRFGISPAGIGQMIAEAAEPALGAAHTTVAKDGRVLTGAARNRFEGEDRVASRGRGDRTIQQSGTRQVQHYTPGTQTESEFSRTMADRWRPAMRDGDRDADGVMDTADNCPDTGSYVTVDQYGCGLFDAVLEDVTFKSGSRWLSPRARGQLDQVAETLLAFPESRVQVRAHTDSQGPADMNLNLSSRRAEVVVQYLQSRGVHELQMQAAGIGEAQPIDSNGNAAGRRRNRRVDIVTLPDQDAGQLLVASGIESARVITVTDPNKRDVDNDDYVMSADEWNSAPPLPVTKKKKAGTQSAGLVSAEPGLQAANPVEAEDARAPIIMPLPEPGFAHGLSIAGVVENLSFDTGSTALTAEGKEALSEIAVALLDNPDIRIAIMAHTDDAGEPEQNLALSRERAQSVVQYLVEEGVSDSRLESEGYGELLPLVQNVTEEDRATNRRIEIRILRNP